MEINFVDQSSSNVSDWNWTFEGGNPTTSTEQNPVVIYETPGTYNVSLFVSNDAGIDSLVQSSFILVNENLPVSDFDIVLVGQVVTFINQSENATDYYWDLNDGYKSTEANLSHDYSVPAFYDIKLIASNGCGSDTSIQTIIVSPNEVLPITDFSANTTLGCLPFTVEYTNLTTPNATEWFWNFPGGDPSISTEQNPIITYDEIGSHWVKLTSKNDSGSNSKFKGDLIEVVENVVPSAAFSLTLDLSDLTCTNNTSEEATYQWFFGDGISSTESSPQHTYAESGVYTIQLIANNLCGSDTLSETIMIDEITSTTLPDFLEAFHVFPNPNNGHFVVNLQGQAQSQITIGLTDILGQEVFIKSYSFIAGQLNQSFDFQKLSSGTYLLSIDSERGKIFRKVIIK